MTCHSQRAAEAGLGARASGSGPHVCPTTETGPAAHQGRVNVYETSWVLADLLGWMLSSNLSHCLLNSESQR